MLANLFSFYCLCYTISFVIQFPDKSHVCFCLWNTHTQIRNKDILFVLLSFHFSAFIWSLVVGSCRESEPQGKYGFLCFPPFIKIDGVNFGSHSVHFEVKRKRRGLCERFRGHCTEDEAIGHWELFCSKFPISSELNLGSKIELNNVKKCRVGGNPLFGKFSKRKEKEVRVLEYLLLIDTLSVPSDTHPPISIDRYPPMLVDSHLNHQVRFYFFFVFHEFFWFLLPI